MSLICIPTLDGGDADSPALGPAKPCCQQLLLSWTAGPGGAEEDEQGVDGHICWPLDNSHPRICSTAQDHQHAGEHPECLPTCDTAQVNS